MGQILSAKAIFGPVAVALLSLCDAINIGNEDILCPRVNMLQTKSARSTHKVDAKAKRCNSVPAP